MQGWVLALDQLWGEAVHQNAGGFHRERLVFRLFLGRIFREWRILFFLLSLLRLTPVLQNLLPLGRATTDLHGQALVVELLLLGLADGFLERNGFLLLQVTCQRDAFIHVAEVRIGSLARLRRLPDGRQLKPGDEVLTFVNRNLEPYRGYHTFMRALPAVLRARPEAQVVIVGGDDVSYGRKPADGQSWKELFRRDL